MGGSISINTVASVPAVASTRSGPSPMDREPAWEDVLQVLPDGVVFVDEDGFIRYVNECAARLSGHRAVDLVGQPVEVLVPAGVRRDHVGSRHAFAAKPSAQAMGTSLEPTLQRKDGSTVPVDIGLAPFRFGSRSWVIATMRDDSARRKAVEARLDIERATGRLLAASEHRFRLSFENNTSGMLLIDPEGRIVRANAAFCEMLGREEGEIIGRDPLELTHPEDRPLTIDTRREVLNGQARRSSYTKRYLHRDGREIWAEVARSRIEDEGGTLSCIVVSVRDITEERTLASQLSYRALHDPLTGLPNRSLFEDRLNHALERSGRLASTPAVVMLDLDGFKEVNDTFGHYVGDQLLVAVARRLEGALRVGDTLCRSGGDEFWYLVEDLGPSMTAEELGDRLLDAFVEPFFVANEQFHQEASLGIAFGSGKDTPEDLLRAADVAMYEAKRLGKGRYVEFSPSLAVRSASNVELRRDLRRSLGSPELMLHYQPIVDLGSGALVGFEGLMRWAHPERGWVAPDAFIPLAEQSDLIVVLGAFAIDEACRAPSSWRRHHEAHEACSVSVNLSVHQLRSPTFLSTIDTALSSSGLSPNRLVLEMTESAALVDIALSTSVFAGLRALGVRIALDDFGTGYSSLSYLSRLRPDIIKIDPSFIARLGTDPYDETVVKAIISLGHELGSVIVAEGIEQRSQLDHLRLLGCDLGQGYLFSPAAPLAQTASTIRAAHEAWRGGPRSAAPLQRRDLRP